MMRHAFVATLAALALGGCLLQSHTATKKVFADHDKVVPTGAAPVYVAGEPAQGYYAFTPAGDRDFIEEAYVLDDKPKPGEPKWIYYDVLQTPRLHFAPLKGDRYIAFYSTTDSWQPLGAAAVDARSATFWDFSKIPEARRAELAAGRGLALKKDSLEGALNPATVRGYFSDLIAENPPAMRLVPASTIPPEVEIAHFTPGPRLAAMTKDEMLSPPAAKYPTGQDLLAWLRAVDKRGNPWGAYVLARLHGNGWVVERDLKRARQFAENAVTRGLPQAKQVLGFLALQEPGADAARKAAILYREAAEAGDGRAMFALSGLYEAGRGVEPSEPKAVEWLRKAAEAGVADAQVALAQRLRQGRGVAANDAQAVEWMRKAANSGYGQAQAGMGWLHAEGASVERNDAEARGWYGKAAERGDAFAQWQFGEFLFAGRGGQKDVKAAIEWLTRANEAGEKRAEKTLKAALDAEIAATEARIKKGDQRIKELDRKIAENNAKIAANNARMAEAQRRSSGKVMDCGERKCSRLDDGRRIYKARAVDVWYFRDGQVAPRELWPR